MPLFENSSNNNSNNGEIRVLNTTRKTNYNSNSNTRSNNYISTRKKGKNVYVNKSRKNTFKYRKTNRNLNRNTKKNNRKSNNNRNNLAMLSNNNNSNSNSTNNNNHTYEKCTICLSSLKSHKKGGVITLECGHKFHRNCICKSYTLTNDKCPLCNKPAPDIKKHCRNNTGFMKANNNFSTSRNNNRVLNRYFRTKQQQRKNSLLFGN